MSRKPNPVPVEDYIDPKTIKDRGSPRHRPRCWAREEGGRGMKITAVRYRKLIHRPELFQPGRRGGGLRR